MFACCGIEALPELLLVARPGADENDGDVSCLGSGNGFWESRFISGPALAAFGVGDSAGGGVADAAERGDIAGVMG